MLVLRTSTPAGHRLRLCLSPTARQFPVPRAAIRAGGRRDKDTERAEDLAFLDDQLEAEARIFTRGNFLGAPHGGHGFAREVR